MPVKNDIHSQELNETAVRRGRPPSTRSTPRSTRAFRRAPAALQPVTIAGGRHAMGGQQFCAGRDPSTPARSPGCSRSTPRAGIVEVEAGIQWPRSWTSSWPAQKGRARSGAIAQKQTGADRLTHRRRALGQRSRPRPRHAAVHRRRRVVRARRPRREPAHLQPRRRTADLFRLAIGGYGLFGVDLLGDAAAHAAAEARAGGRGRAIRRADRGLRPSASADGFLYGDFQFAIDDDFGRLPQARRVLLLPAASPDARPCRRGQRELGDGDWQRALFLAHTDKRRGLRALRRALPVDRRASSTGPTRTR